MTLEAREYTTEGHRLLCESTFSPAEIAKLAGQPRQRVSEWRTGRKRPVHDARVALERAIGIPVRTWEQPPLRRAPPAAPAEPPPPAQPAPGAPTGGANVPAAVPGATSPMVADVERLDLPSLGLGGLERLAARLRALEPSLPPRERVSALQAEARVLAVHEQLRQREADAREEFLASPEFRADARTLVAAVARVPAEALRVALLRLGVAVPAPPADSGPELEPPTTAEELDELLGELEVAKRFRDGGELALAAAHVAGLALDVHADAIAELLVGDSGRAARMLELLDEPDERAMSTALARAMAVRDVRALPPEARTTVAQLVQLLGHETLATQIGAPHGPVA